MESVFTLVLVTHIATMCASLIASVILVLTALSNFGIDARFVKGNYVVTGVGIATGIGLLVIHPAPSTCLMLVSYVAAFQLAHRYIVLPKTKFAINR